MAVGTGQVKPAGIIPEWDNDIGDCNVSLFSDTALNVARGWNRISFGRRTGLQPVK